MGAKYKVDPGIAFKQGFRKSFFLGHAASDSDDQIRIGFKQLFVAADFPENIVGRIFADAAGVHQNDIGLFGCFGRLIAARF